MTSEMRQTHSETQDLLGGWGVGVRDIPDPGVLTQVCTVCEFEDLNIDDGYPGAGEIAPDGYYLTVLGQESFAVDPFLFAIANDGYGGTFDVNNLTPAAFDDNTIEEDIISAYVSAAFEGEIAGMVTETAVGLRYESTDVNSTAQQNKVTEFTWQSDNDFNPVFDGGLLTLNESYSYTNVLPNIDFSVDISDNWKGRASVSQTIARPQYNDLFATTGVARRQP